MDNFKVVGELQNALSLIMNSQTEPSLRKNAYQFCEDFKENSNQCVECGIIMARAENDQIIRHFGLQLLEHCVKFRWNNMSREEKEYIKENALLFVSSGTLGISSEHKHIKDALTRIIVEIAKREWPQQWVSMVSEFDAICRQGRTQAELILLVFLRLAEDVLIFQTTPAQRRKEISQGLASIIPQLFSFFFLTLTSNYEDYKRAKNEQASDVVASCVQVISVTCEVFSSFIDSISINLLTADNGQLLFLLFDMLSELPLQIPVADLLLEIASKKGKSEERQPLIEIFLSTNALIQLVQVAISSEKNCVTEQGFMFFKKLCQVIVMVGTQLCLVMSYLPSLKCPENLDKIINLILSFSIHPSQVVSCYCMPLWMSMLKCDKITELDVTKQAVNQFFMSSINMLMKAGNLYQDNNQKCIYARFDFDSDEFLQFQRKYRSEVCDVIRLATILSPKFALSFISEKLAQLLCKSANQNDVELLHTEWDAVVACLESAAEKVDFMNINEDIILSVIDLYKNVLDFHTPDPTICSFVLSIISSFFPLIARDTSILSKVLDKLFSYVLFNIPGQTKSTRSKVVKNVRRHACSILVKICKMYPDLLLPGFNYLFDHIKKISNDPEELSQMEKGTCYEALILIHNRKKNYREQADFLREITQPVSTYWLSQSFTETVWSVDKLMDFIGVTRPPVEPSSEDVCGINRSQIQYCLTFISGVLKRSAWPSSEEEALSGGFIYGHSADSLPLCRSPATEVVTPLLNNIFGIIKSYHEIFIPENFSKVYPDFVASFQMSEADRLMLMGIVKPMGSTSDIVVTKDPVERMLAFFKTLSEFGYSILGNCCRYLGFEFYSSPSLSNLIFNSVLSNIFILSELKIKQLFHSFLKPLAQNCPKEFHSSVILVVLRSLSPLMYQYLTTKWQILQNKHNESKDSQDGSDVQENQELLEEQLLRSVTREYFDFIDCLFRDRKSQQQQANQQHQQANGTEANDEMMMVEDGDGLASSRRTKDEVLGELGNLILQNDDVFPPIVLLLFVSLSWEDSTTCMKSILWCFPVLKQLVALQKVSSDYARDFFQSLLIGLNVHGQHDTVMFSIINALVQTYELMVPHFPSVREILLSVPGCTKDSVQAFDARFFVNASSLPKNFEKKKREHFKTMIDGAIGKNIGQRYKNPVYIKNLAPFRLFRQKQKELLEQVDVKDLGLCSLFSPNN